MLLISGITLRNALQTASNSGFKHFYKGDKVYVANPTMIAHVIGLLDKDREHVFHKKKNWKIRINKTDWSCIKKMEKDDNVTLWLTL